MSLPEIIPSNLPIFVQNKNRSAFANSVIPSGAVLLFAESDGQGGSKLIAKNPDGSYTEVGGGGSTSFYKCASVDTSNHTWTGYLASIDDSTGIWSFAETTTSGLSYDRITPSVGSVYDEECSFEVVKYNTGFHGHTRIPLINSLNISEGDLLNYTSTSGYSFVTESNVECMKCNGLAAVYTLPEVYTTTEASFSFWAKGSDEEDNALAFGVTVGWIPAIYAGSTPNQLWKIATGSSWVDKVADFNGWVNFILLYVSGTPRVYINGSKFDRQITPYTDGDALGGFTIGAYSNGSQPYHNYIADIQCWNRVLTVEEITAIYSAGPHGTVSNS